MTPTPDDLRALARKRDRLAAALSQAQFELERMEQEVREAGVPDSDIQRALLGKPAPRLVRAEPPPTPPPTKQPMEPPPRRVDLGREGFWTDD